MKICKVNNYVAPAKDSQGTQRVLEAVGRQLEKDGHTVYLLLDRGSELNFGTLVTSIPEDTDIVHYHGGFPHEYGHSHGFKWVTTAHGGAIDTKERMEKVKDYTDHIIFVSQFCADMYNSKCVVYNCVEDKDFIFKENKEDYFLWMAGTDWGEQKGLFSSIALAKKLGFKLKIAGGGKNLAMIEEIKKHCNNKIEYLGSVNGQEKAELLAGAKALLMIGTILDAGPVNVLESFASGTPVITRHIASHPEVVEKDVGFVCKSDIEIVKAIMKIDKIDPNACRRYYLNKFTSKKSAENHLLYYDKMLKSNTVL